MATPHSRNAVYKLDNADGSLTSVQRYFQTVNVKRSASPGDGTAIGDKGEHTYAGLVDVALDGAGFANPTIDAILQASLSFQKSFESDPGSTSTGQPVYAGECIGASYEISGSFDGMVMFSWAADGTGAVSRSTN